MTERQGAIVPMLVASPLHLHRFAWMTPAGSTAVVIGIFGLTYLASPSKLGLTERPGMWLARTMPAIGAAVALGGVVTGQQPPFPWMAPLVILTSSSSGPSWSRMTVARA